MQAIYKHDTLCYTSRRDLDLLGGLPGDGQTACHKEEIFLGLESQARATVCGCFTRRCSMAGWEEELAILLQELGVRQEEPKAHLRATRKPMRSDVKRQEQIADALIWGDDGVDDDAWINDLNMMRREVDSIVNQVVLLMQRGDLDTSLKEDVIVVLRALRRRASVTQQAASSDEAYLESASAMLHFCRLVLQLSEFATDD
jgi:hypothetical protein